MWSVGDTLCRRPLQKRGLLLGDGQDGSGYAWLAFGRFDPPVVKLPSVGPDVIRTRQQSAAEIAGSLHLTALENRLSEMLAAGTVEPGAAPTSWPRVSMQAT